MGIIELQTTKLGHSPESSKAISDRLSETNRLIREERRQKVGQLLAMGTKKELFNPSVIFKGCFEFEGEALKKALQDQEWVEQLQQEYYLDHPEIKNNVQFANLLNSQE